MKPREMHESDEDEKKYIIKKLYESERRHKLKDYNLTKGTYVKYIVPRDGKKKHRYRVSPECYKIADKDGHAYIIMAKDGSTLTLSRWRLIPVGATLPAGMKLARSVNDAKGGIIDKILNYIPHWVRPNVRPRPRPQNVYFILWKSPDGERITTHEPIGLFKRERQRPDKLTREEKAYWGTRVPPAEVLPPINVA
jgi:hypothetical protein